jgi:hypothetical protein
MATATKEAKQSGHEKVAAFLGEKPARTGAELVKALRLSGTPDPKLRPARDLLERGRDEGRQVTAAEALAALEEAQVSPGTLEKARTIVASGKIAPPPSKAPAVEDLILAEAEPKPAAKK